MLTAGPRPPCNQPIYMAVKGEALTPTDHIQPSEVANVNPIPRSSQ
jgi:hypothetical protein